MAAVSEAARAFGLMVDVEPEVFMLWPENAAPFALFDQMQSQWRTGPNGPIGLDYSALPDRCRIGVAGRRGRRLREGLQLMEAEALKWFSERRG